MKELQMMVEHLKSGEYIASCQELEIYFTASSIEDLKAAAGVQVGKAFRKRGEHLDVICIHFTYVDKAPMPVN